MPNIIARKLENIKFPIKKDEVEFEFSAIYGNEKLISCKIEDKRFFILERKKDNGDYLIKSDKVTRISPLRLIAKAILK